MIGKEPNSQALRYAYGYTDKKPGLVWWAIHAAMLIFVGYNIFSLSGS
jgi:hypothetical protein